MVHKVFDTDYLSRSFKQSGKMLLTNLSRLLKDYCFVFKTTLKTDFVCDDEIAARRHIIKSHKKTCEVEETWCFVHLGIFSAYVLLEISGSHSLQSFPKTGSIFLAHSLFTGTCLHKVRSAIETHLSRICARTERAR